MTLKEPASESRVERKKERTKQKILSTAMGLFRKQGFDGTTMEQIADQADIAKGTLYNYFPVKEAILNEFIKGTFRERNSERIQRMRQLPDTRARMVAVLRELMDGVRAQMEIFEKYFVYRIQTMISLRQDESMQSGLWALESEIIALGQKNGEIRTDLPFDLLTGLFEFVFIEVAQQLYKDPERFNAQETIQQCVDLFIDGARDRA
jgi:AcrR family transcriptional regulator